MSLETILEVYGYPALFVGTFLEGETPLVMAGFLAHRGYLTLPTVVLVAFVATIASDQLFFHLGRTRGRSFLDRRPAWHERAARGEALLARHGTALVIGFRFLYGLRTVTPVVIGMSGFDSARFLLLNMIGGALWAAVVGGIGYSLGGAASLLFEDLRQYDAAILLGLAGVAACVWVTAAIRRRRRTRGDGDSLACSGGPGSSVG